MFRLEPRVLRVVDDAAALLFGAIVEVREAVVTLPLLLDVPILLAPDDPTAVPVGLPEVGGVFSVFPGGVFSKFFIRDAIKPDPFWGGDEADVGEAESLGIASGAGGASVDISGPEASETSAMVV